MFIILPPHKCYGDAQITRGMFNSAITLVSSKANRQAKENKSRLQTLVAYLLMVRKKKSPKTLPHTDNEKGLFIGRIFTYIVDFWEQNVLKRRVLVRGILADGPKDPSLICNKRNCDSTPSPAEGSTIAKKNIKNALTFS